MRSISSAPLETRSISMASLLGTTPESGRSILWLGTTQSNTWSAAEFLRLRGSYDAHMRPKGTGRH